LDLQETAASAKQPLTPAESGNSTLGWFNQKKENKSEHVESQILRDHILYIQHITHEPLPVVIVLVRMSKTHVAVAAACGGASNHAAGNGVSSPNAGAIKWCCSECISATGAGNRAVLLFVNAVPSNTVDCCRG